MPDLSTRSYQKELLDRDDIPFEAIKRNMQELEIINTYLGGHKITIDGLKKLLDNRTGKDKEILICEIGCGGGDNLKAIEKWCYSNQIKANYIGIDINEFCIQYAKENGSMLEAEWICSDYKKVFFENKPDILFSSLFCHHFSEEELFFMLGWMKQNARLGFFINDLHRHICAYYSIKILTSVFSKSYLVKNDAPLSVKRGFRKKEWRSLLKEAGISDYGLHWKWAFRWLITYKA